VKINQVNFTYSPLEDRLLFRLNTTSKVEFRMWLTRAMSLKLLGFLNQAVKQSIAREQPAMPASALDTLGEFRREAAIAKADYESAFSPEAQAFPLGPNAVLVAGIVVDSGKPAPVLIFKLATGQEVNISLDHDLGAAISKLLTTVLESLDWGNAPKAPTAPASEPGEKTLLH
jgi:hypothetical protein